MKTLRKKPRPVVQSHWIKWKPEHRELFRLAPADWTPPSKLRVTFGRTGYTMSAQFITHTGGRANARIRFVREAGDTVSITDESLSLAFRTKTGGAPRVAPAVSG